MINPWWVSVGGTPRRIVPGLPRCVRLRSGSPRIRSGSMRHGAAEPARYSHGATRGAPTVPRGQSIKSQRRSGWPALMDLVCAIWSAASGSGAVIDSTTERSLAVRSIRRQAGPRKKTGVCAADLSLPPTHFISGSRTDMKTPKTCGTNVSVSGSRPTGDRVQSLSRVCGGRVASGLNVKQAEKWIADE